MYDVVKGRGVTVSFVTLTKTLPRHVGVGYTLILESLPRIRAVPKSADLDTECRFLILKQIDALIS
jgi:hypothetical protein